jgi:hypothetical protein
MQWVGRPSGSKKSLTGRGFSFTNVAENSAFSQGFHLLIEPDFPEKLKTIRIFMAAVWTIPIVPLPVISDPPFLQAAMSIP